LFQGAYQVTKSVANAGDLIFESSEKKNEKNTNKQNQHKEDHTSISKAIDGWVNRPSSNPASGIARGLVSFGTHTVKGVTGIVSEPIKGAMEDGGKGFAIGVVKGLTGVVAKPIAGLMELGAKTTEGFVSAPLSIAEGIGIKNKDSQESKGPLYFGVPLEESFQYSIEHEQVHIAEHCIEYLHKNGTSIEGIFRISGSTSTIQSLKQKTDNGEDIVFDDSIWPHDVSGLLKLYLRELPDGLIPPTVWLPLFDSTGNDFDLKVYNMIMNVGPFTKVVLFKLLHLLEIIITNAEITKMTPSNLAVCLSPCILRSPITGTDMQGLEYMQKSQKVFVSLLSSWKNIMEQMQNAAIAPPRKIAQSQPPKYIPSTESPPTEINSHRDRSSSQHLEIHNRDRSSSHPTKIITTSPIEEKKEENPIPNILIHDNYVDNPTSENPNPQKNPI
jgi:hypothetical protein